MAVVHTRTQAGGGGSGNATTLAGVTPGAGGLLFIVAASLIAGWRLLNAVPTTLTVTAGAVTWVPNTDRRASFTVVQATTLTVTTTNLAVGDEVDLAIIQDGTGGWEVTFPSTFLLTQGPHLTAAARTEYKFRWDGTSFRPLAVSGGKRRKTVSAATYTVVREDHRGEVRLTNAAVPVVTLLDRAANPSFEYEVWAEGGAATLNPAGADRIVGYAAALGQDSTHPMAQGERACGFSGISYWEKQ